MKKLLYLSAIICLFSCKKDPDPIPKPLPPAENYLTNDIFLNVTNMSNNDILQISKDTVYSTLTPKYINANNDTFSVTTFKYYLSNIKFKKSDGTWVEEKPSNHLVSIADTNSYCKFNLKNIPYGEYTDVEFLIGIDSLLNCSGAQAGDLSASNDMFWSWNQGYIFLKFEAYSSSSYPSTNHNITYHVGGYKLPYNNIKKVNLSFGTDTLKVGSNIPKLYLKANVQKMFTNSQSNINFSTMGVIMSASGARLLADNYSSMFIFGGVKN